ncbi:hypothetical protein K435DRAFT_803443 [Dendrothele bispora CBS 962.96]|uniref:Uncharacterized protein n=1 Tax=Dendrothele bispora (strain CBS 962.96) TaxID=1314807 RepID=A0A4S8LI47_DENBC|nr:hypothetical protein K435DRAFT_803443 [Dendrothele bispora CBS 962.96]
MTSLTINVDPSRHISPVDPRIYPGFTEHMGRCIYGGIYGSDPKTGFRKDVLAALKELVVIFSANTNYANLQREEEEEESINRRSKESQDYAKKAYQWVKVLRLI